MNDSSSIQFGLLFSPPSDALERLRNEFHDVRFVEISDSDDRSLLSGVQGLLAWSLSIEDLDAAPNLQWVQWVGAGVEQVPLSELQSRSIVLTNNRGVHAPNIAEHVLALMLAFTRQLPTLFEAQLRKQWLHWSDHERVGPIGELQGSRLLILGAGNIGLALAERAEALGVSINIVGRSARNSTRKIEGIERLDELLPESDHVAICVPLTSETNGLFDANRLALMKPTARLYNIGRGSIVDTDALTDALVNGRLGGAGLDVSDPEPLPPDHALWNAPNLIITSHTSGITPHYWDRAYAILAENLRRFLEGRPLINVVQLELGY